MRITETPLFKSIAPYIKSITKKQLAKELAIVKKKGGAGVHKSTWEETHLSEAFVWWRTPQGHEFWTNIFIEVSGNKRQKNEQ